MPFYQNLVDVNFCSSHRLRPSSIRRPLRSTRQPQHRRPSAVACRGAHSGLPAPSHGHVPLRSKWDDRRRVTTFFAVFYRGRHNPVPPQPRGCRVENPAETGGCRSWECMLSSLRVGTACPVSSDRVFSRLPTPFIILLSTPSPYSGEGGHLAGHHVLMVVVAVRAALKLLLSAKQERNTLPQNISLKILVHTVSVQIVSARSASPCRKHRDLRIQTSNSA